MMITATLCTIGRLRMYFHFVGVSPLIFMVRHLKSMWVGASIDTGEDSDERELVPFDDFYVFYCFVSVKS